MKFFIGSDGWAWLNWAAYEGTIGVFYKNTFWGILAYIIFGLICIFTIIGLFSTLKWLFTRKKKNKD